MTRIPWRSSAGAGSDSLWLRDVLTPLGSGAPEWQCAAVRNARAGLLANGRLWKVSSSEEQGMSSTSLAKAVDLAARESFPIHSLLIVRHGYVTNAPSQVREEAPLRDADVPVTPQLRQSASR